MFTPDYADCIGLAKHLNSDELKSLLNDDTKLEVMVKDLRQIKTIEAEKEMLMASNKSLAEYNLSLQPMLEVSRQNLIQTYLTASDLKTGVLAKKQQLEGLDSTNKSDVALARLQTAASKAEENTEEYVEKLLNGELSIDDFLESYLKKRTSAHVLKTKSEKMKALLLKGNFSVPPPEKPVRSRRAPLPPPVAPGILPYPPISMPYPPVSAPNHGAMQPHNVSPNVPPVILPTRQAPRPPGIPRRNSNPPSDRMKLLPQLSLAGQVSTSSQPMPSVPNAYHVYPKYVRLPLPN